MCMGRKGRIVFTELPFPFSGHIYRSGMPFGPFDHFNQIWSKYHQHGVDLVVVLLEQAEIVTYAQRDLISHYQEWGMDVIHLPVPDGGLPPDLEAYHHALREGARRAKAGQDIAVHCLAGLGRTGTFLACLARREMGLNGPDALAWVREAIPGAVENPSQEQFVIDYSYEVESC